MKFWPNYISEIIWNDWCCLRNLGNGGVTPLQIPLIGVQNFQTYLRWLRCLLQRQHVNFINVLLAYTLQKWNWNRCETYGRSLCWWRWKSQWKVLNFVIYQMYFVELSGADSRMASNYLPALSVITYLLRRKMVAGERGEEKTQRA